MLIAVSGYRYMALRPHNMEHRAEVNTNSGRVRNLERCGYYVVFQRLSASYSCFRLPVFSLKSSVTTAEVIRINL